MSSLVFLKLPNADSVLLPGYSLDPPFPLRPALLAALLPRLVDVCHLVRLRQLGATLGPWQAGHGARLSTVVGTMDGRESAQETPSTLRAV